MSFTLWTATLAKMKRQGIINFERTCIVMIDTPATTIESSPIVSGAQSEHDWPPMWRRLALAVVMLVSIFMNFYQLGQNGFGNLYYASAIRSMLDSWHYPLKYSYSPVRL
jgi:hypothetical protein